MLWMWHYDGNIHDNLQQNIYKIYIKYCCPTLLGIVSRYNIKLVEWNYFKSTGSRSAYS